MTKIVKLLGIIALVAVIGISMSACVMGLPPDTPTGLYAWTISLSSIGLSWNSVAAADGYYVYQSSSSYGTYVYIGSTTSTSTTVYGLSSNTTYYYRVSAYNSFGESGQSTYDYATTYSSFSGGTSASSPYYLTAGAWATGNISSSYLYCAFYVTYGNTYYVWWDDSYSGSGSYTKDVYVSAYYYNDSSTAFSEADSAYNTPRSFTANQNGYVILRIRPYNATSTTGTFAIVYNTNSTRPYR